MIFSEEKSFFFSFSKRKRTKNSHRNRDDFTICVIQIKLVPNFLNHTQFKEQSLSALKQIFTLSYTLIWYMVAGKLFLKFNLEVIHRHLEVEETLENI